MKLNICIDIDGTITDSYFWIKYLNKFFGFNLKDEDIVKFDICRVANISEEDYQRFYDKWGEEMHLNAIIRDGAASVLKKLSEKHNIYYITARPEKYRQATEAWMDKNDLPRGEIYMMGNHNKEEKAKELQCDVFIEDRYRNAVMIAKEGIKTLLIDSNYNRYPLIEDMIRVYDWNDIYNEISRIEQIKKEQAV